MLTRKRKKFAIAVLLENFGRGRATPHIPKKIEQKLASENCNSAASKRFRIDPELGEKTIRSFKQMYLCCSGEKKAS